MKLLSFVLLVLCTFFFLKDADGATRLHRGPRREQGVKLLCGHTLAEVDKEMLMKMGIRNAHYGQHVVDIDLHLKHDVVMWDELEDDQVSFKQCEFYHRSRLAVVTFTGPMLDISDFRPGTVFAIEQAKFEMACYKNLPTYPDIDAEDDYSFFRIWKVVRAGRDGILVYMKLISGRYVIPAVDIHVHRDEASPSQIDRLKDDIVYDNDNEDDEMDDEIDTGVRAVRIAQ